MNSLPTFDDVQRAAGRLRGQAHRTPVLRSSSADALTGAQLFFKCENFQRMGAFKFRGAFNALSQLDADARRRGVIAFSSGNHAQAVAWAAHGAGVSATVVMPDGAVQMKVDATRAFGADVVLTPGAELLPTMRRLQDERDLVFIPPFDDRYIVAGAATCGEGCRGTA